MTPPLGSPAVRWARRGCEWIACAWALALLAVIATRLTFPLDLEWMEGGALQQALRIQRGAPIYGPPTLEYAPFLYTPLYSHLLAALGWLFPLDYPLGRAVSVLATASVGVAIWRAVDREGKPRAHAITAVGLFLSGYVFTFRWIDLARADMVALAFATWGAVMLREAWGDRRKTVLAAVLMGAAFWTKQTGFLFGAAGVLAGLIVAPRQLWIYVGVLAFIGGGGVLWGQHATDGWLWTYIYELHQTHAFNHERFTTKTWGMFLHAGPFVALVLLGLTLRFWWPQLVATRRLDGVSRERAWLRLRAHRGLAHWLLFSAAGLLASALGYSTQWAEPNAFLPGVIFVAVLVGVALPEAGRAELVALIGAGLQMLFAAFVEPMYQPIQSRGWAGVADSYDWQDLSRTVPSTGQRRRAAALRETLVHGGPVLALQRPWWSVLAGGPGHVGSMNLNDIPAERRLELRRALAAKVKSGDYAAVYLEGEVPGWLRASLARTYTLNRRRLGEERVRPLSGYMSEAGMVTPYRAAQLAFGLPRARPRDPSTRVVADFEDSTLDGFDLHGRAFGRAPVRSLHRKLDAVGPIGGEYLLSSAASSAGLRATGTAYSSAFQLPAAGGRLELLVGRIGRRRGLAVALEGLDRESETRLPIHASSKTLVPVTWTVPPAWAGRTVRLKAADDDKRGAVLLDDIWLVESPS
ncbi:MAG: DUF2029 domain-containing protein [Myxococcales bacterium FL481]|nr:MAG: DUF2029 domain-containing protein [Myxococcales bacterium FL481]